MSQLCEIALDGRPGCVRRARAFVDSCLKGWGVDELREAACLLTSELVTNAVVHARTVLSLTVVLDERLRIEVTDGSPNRPRIQDPTPDIEGGRGLLLVAQVAERWGTRLERTGKTVWFDLEPGTDPLSSARYPDDRRAPGSRTVSGRPRRQR